MTQVSSLYIHVPFCRHLCNYCDFFKKRFERPKEQIEEFHRSLSQGIERHERFMQQYQITWAPLESVYLGGGTPSLWGIEGAKFFKQHWGHHALDGGAEFTMEIDPGTWNEDLIKAWSEQGLNRISIGTQTLDPQFLKIMDRNHGVEESFELLTFCHKHNWNFSLDFLLGLPFSKESKRDIESELRRLLDFAPKHVSLYILNARSKYPHIQSLPDDEFIREEYLFVSEFLKSQGFHHYEVSNFALPGFESRHNIKYWRSQSVAALGPTGTGLFVLGDSTALRYKWKVSHAEIESESLGLEELRLEKTYLSLRTFEGWQPEQVSHQHLKTFEYWTSQNYGTWDGDRVRLTSLGFLMLDSLMDDLFKIPAMQ